MKRINEKKSYYDEYIKKVEIWEIPKSEKKYVLNFFKDYELGKITSNIAEKRTLEHYVVYLKVALEFLKKETDKITEKNIDKFAIALIKDEILSGHKTPFAQSVKAKIRRTLLQYLDWRIPKKSSSINSSLKVKNKQKQKDYVYLTENEIDKTYEMPQVSRFRFVTASVDGRVEMAWNENKDPNFLAYEIHRSDKMPVTRESTLIFSTRDRQLLEYVDVTPKLAKIYYYKVFTINDLSNVGESEDKLVRIPEITDPGIYGFITENTVWDLKTSPVIIKGDLTIEKGIKLVISPGVEVKFLSKDVISSGRFTDKSELIVKGTLVAVGENGESIRFTSGSVYPEKDGWGGIWFNAADGGTNNRLERCLIEYAKDGIRVDSTDTGFYNLRIERCSSSGIDISNSKVSIGNTIINDIGEVSGIGLRGSGNASVFMSNCIVNNVKGTGLLLEGAAANVSNNIISYCSLIGISGSDVLLPNVYNNVVYECKTGISKLSASGTNVADFNDLYFVFKSDYKLYENTVAGANDLNIFPKFTKVDWSNPQNGDFSLEPTSILLKKGISGGIIGLNNPLSIGVK